LSGAEEGFSGRPIGRSLDAYLASEGLSAVKLIAALVEAWPEIVGEALAAHSSPRTISGGELIVAVDHPARVVELAFVSAQICEYVSDQVGFRLVGRVKGRVDARLGLE
jgi:hypothetical protein